MLVPSRDAAANRAAAERGKGSMAWKQGFRVLMCTLCALLFVFNARGAQHASAEGAAT